LSCPESCAYEEKKEVTPFEEWEKKRLTLSYLRTWGCLAKVSVSINKKCKLGPKMVDCVFLGYAFHIVGYRFLVVRSGVPDLLVGTIMESRGATFFENIFPVRDETSSSRQESVEKDDFTKSMELNEPTFIEHPEEDNDEAPRRSKRQRIEKFFGDNFIIYLVDDTLKTILEAYSSPDADYWKEAVRSEMDSIMSNGTWEVVERPYGCKPMGCKWVLKKKLRPDGTIDKYKARLVAKDYTQNEGQDFFDNYSPVARLTTISLLLSLAASYGLLVHQMDVNTAFLNGELEEEIYMDQPEGFVVKGQEGMVCKLCIIRDSDQEVMHGPRFNHNCYSNRATVLWVRPTSTESLSNQSLPRRSVRSSPLHSSIISFFSINPRALASLP
jgi:hypothetical protein